jgi:hypothetical protein
MKKRGESLEAECLYEYMRESGVLRGALNAPTEEERKEKARNLVTLFFLNFSAEGFFRLMVALQAAGFPDPWKELRDAGRAELVSLLRNWTERNGKRYPPVVIEQGWPEYDSLENCWRVGHSPFESSLFKGREPWGWRPFVGFIRIDPGCTETEAVEAFKNEFRKHWPKTKGGGGVKWRDRLNQLEVMRIWKQFPDDPNKRVKQIARLPTGFKGCRDYLEKRRKAIREKREVEPRLSKTARAEMSRARRAARTFFKSLFPGEEPLNY